MPIEVEWDNAEQTILRLDFHAPWNWEAYEAAVLKSSQLIGTAAQPVVMIVNGATIEQLPQGALSHFRQSEFLVPGNLGCICVVNANPLIRLVISTVGKLSPQIGKRLRIADSLEEARRHVGHEANLSV